MNEQKSSVLTLPVAIVLGSVIIAGAVFFTNKSASRQANPEQPSIALADVSSSDHVRGNGYADTTLVVYADFECPYCAVLHETLKKKLADSSDSFKWVYRNLPIDSIHPQARPSALAAECVADLLGNDAYWKFTDALFAGQSELGDALYTQEAATLGANAEAFAECVSSKKFEERINTDIAEAMGMGVQGTPFTVVIGKNGTKIPFSGALPESQINAVIQAAGGK